MTYFAFPNAQHCPMLNYFNVEVETISISSQELVFPKSQMTPVLKTLSLKEEEKPNDTTQLPFAKYGMSKMQKPYRSIYCKKLQCQNIYFFFFFKNMHVTLSL